MSRHTRWAVRAKDGMWQGANTGTHHTHVDGRYVHRPGYRWTPRFELARLFSRKSDATKAASAWAATVVPVDVEESQ